MPLIKFNGTYFLYIIDTEKKLQDCRETPQIIFFLLFMNKMSKQVLLNKIN